MISILEKEYRDLLKKDKFVLNYIKNKCLDSIWYLDLENPNRQWISDNIWLELGYKLTDKNASLENWKNHIYPEDLINAEKKLIKYINGKSNRYEVILRCKHKNGSTIYLESKAIKIIEKNNKPNRVIGYNANVTSAVNYKRKIKETNKLSKKNKDLEEKNKSLTEFSYLTSHDLQSPLNTIISYLSILDEERDNMNEITNVSVDAIKKSAYRMKTFINSLLKYIVIGEDRVAEHFNIYEIIEEVKTSLFSLIKEKNAQITVKGINFETKGYKQDYYRVLFNIINNALKYTEVEKIPKILINIEEKNDVFKFSISDNGIGIEKKHLDIIFEAFKRLHSKDDYEGTGIGLAECKKIIDLNKGKIWVDSVLGKGSTFNFTFSKID